MNLNDPTLLDLLAARYVIGTMRGAARRRFERHLATSFEATQAVWQWERRFDDLVEQLPDTAPPDHVWAAVDRGTTGTAKPAPRRAWLAAAAAILLGIFIGALLPQAEGPAPERQVAVVQNDASEPQWLVRVDLDEGRLITQALNTPARELDQAFELWALDTAGTPRSLGLLPVDGAESSQAISPAIIGILKDAALLAVSVEPLTGSPEPIPTGPVILTAPILSYEGEL